MGIMTANHYSINQELFFCLSLSSAHVVPLLLNLMECREAHVRLVLLEHIACYAPICPQGELIDVVLPEVR